MSDHLPKSLLPVLGLTVVATLASGLVLQGRSDLGAWAPYVGGFLSNISAGLVGSLVTLYFVDRLLLARERLREAPADERVLERVRWFCHRCLSVCREGVGFGVHYLRYGPSFSIGYMRGEELRFSIQNVLPTLDERIAGLTVEQMFSFSAPMPEIHKQAEHLILLFERRLPSAVTACLLDVARVTEYVPLILAASVALGKDDAQKRQFGAQNLAARVKELLGAAHCLADLVGVAAPSQEAD